MAISWRSINTDDVPIGKTASASFGRASAVITPTVPVGRPFLVFIGKILPGVTSRMPYMVHKTRMFVQQRFIQGESKNFAGYEYMERCARSIIRGTF